LLKKQTKQKNNGFKIMIGAFQKNVYCFFCNIAVANTIVKYNAI